MAWNKHAARLSRFNKVVESHDAGEFSALLSAARCTIIEYDLCRGLIESLVVREQGIVTINSTLEMMDDAKVQLCQSDIHPPLWSLVQYVLGGGTLSVLS